MTDKYNPADIEPKWQQKWEADGLYHSDIDESRPKYYALTMLPYPSGDLHIGHWYAMTPSDARARYLRMRGFNVLFPMGFDAFGLPAENAAIQRNLHPKKWTYANIENMVKQLKSMGAMFDWRRQAISADPEYYKWTQWFFLKLYEKGLVYRKMAAVDYCPKDNTTLAREQVVGEKRVCERCGTPVIKKNLEQWFFRITNYADELLHFEGMDWPEAAKSAQTNWIGRSEGARVTFKTENADEIEIFTTRPDTLWGATFMVLAPEHPLVEQVTTGEQRAAVETYVAETTRQTDIEREATDREKTGVFTGGYAINPVNEERVPIWIADYVLMGYGTGAIMAVPAHDQRDFEFARKFDLNVRPVIQDPDAEALDGASMTAATAHYGAMVNSGPLTGTDADAAVNKTITYLEKNELGEGAVIYRLRDWLISRQRYWGAPIPMVYCQTCGVQPVPEDQLPVLLPDDIEWRPTGESPLKFHPTWKQTTCPNCDEPAERETDTMDTFMCSSWYHLRYLSPDYADGPFSQQEYDYWMPVDTYTGGAEHYTMHLIYTRFFHKALRDMGITEGHEPMLQYRSQGQILGPDGQRMSKSRGNVIDPDEQVANYGADTVRAYLMFGYRWNEGGPWMTENIQGVVRWLHRVWSLVREGAKGVGNATAERDLNRKLHQTIQSVGQDLEEFEFNTIVSALMELTNTLQDVQGQVGAAAWDAAMDAMLRLMAPITPHIAEELWAQLGKPYSVHTQSWPEFDAEAAQEDEITLVVQVNGKVRDRITVPAGISEADAQEKALASEAVQQYVDGQTPQKIIVIKGKLVNIVL
jgi:leucyl-tRNA synthetase